jgi:hypothetical protein
MGQGSSKGMYRLHNKVLTMVIFGVFHVKLKLINPSIQYLVYASQNAMKVKLLTSPSGEVIGIVMRSTEGRNQGFYTVFM